MEPKITKRLVDEGQSVSVELKELLERAHADLPDQDHLDAMWSNIGEGMTGAPNGAGGSATGLKIFISLGIVALVATGIIGWRGSVSSDPEKDVVQKELHPLDDGDAIAKSTHSVALNEGNSPRISDVSTIADPVQSPPMDELQKNSVGGKTKNKGKKNENAIAGQLLSKKSEKPSEGTLLIRARRSLDGNPRGALNLTRIHLDLYPKGKLTQERELIAIEALVRLGNKEAAQVRAGSFAMNFPGSPHLKKVERISNGL